MPDPEYSARLKTSADAIVHDLHLRFPEDFPAEIHTKLANRLVASLHELVKFEDLEGKKAALCQLLMLAIDRGEHGDPTQPALMSVRQALGRCFNTTILDSYTLEELYATLDAAWAARS